MVKSKLFLSCALIVAFCIANINMFAQMVGSDGYIQGSVVEIGIRGAGGFEGVDQFVSPPPAGYHARTTTTPFGFIANPQLNSWAGSAYDGDFFTPGSPENGWGIEIGTSAGVFGGNNGSGGSPFLNQIPGTLSLANVSNCLTSDWEGDMTSGTDLHFRISWLLHTNDLFYTTTISITNNTTATIPDMYYYRNVDPDNNLEMGGGFSTTNTIVSQPGSTAGCELAHVSATASTPWSTYLGFAAIGPNWRADYGGFSNRDASDLWTGTGFTQTVGSSMTADIAMSLAYRIQNLAPGATETFSFVTILASSQISAAINDMINITYPGAIGTAFACDPDTIPTCGAPVPISLSGAGGISSNFSWSWSPAAGLSTTTGTSVIANPAVTTTYTATGTPLPGTCAAFSPVTISFVVLVTPSGGNNPYITPVPVICVSDPPVTLVVDSSGGVWSVSPSCGGCLNTSTGVFNPLTAGPGTYTVAYTTTSACNPQDTMVVTVAGSDPTITATAPVCAGSAAFTMTSASPGGTWSATCGTCISGGGVFDPTTAGTFTVTYSIAGSCTAVDTQLVVVNPTIPPTTGFSYASSPVCIGGTNPTITPVAGFTSGGVFSSTPAGLSINTTSGTVNLSSSAAGTYTVTYSYAATGCGPAGSSTSSLVILPLVAPTLGFTYPPTSCEGDTTDATPTTVTGFTSGGVYSWTSSTGGTLVIDDSTGVVDVSASTPGTYTITYTVPGSTSPCAASGNNSFTYTINPLPTILLGAAQTVWIGGSTWLYATSTGPSPSFSWNPTLNLSCPTCDSTTANPPETTEYCVTVTELGCSDSACVKVGVEIPCPANRNMGVPNAFSPNNDGVNDQFCLDGWGDCVSKFSIVIFDRWGEKVFESQDPGFCWNGIYNGKIMDPAVFVYFIKASYESAGTLPDSPRGAFEANKTGNISLVR